MKIPDRRWYRIGARLAACVLVTLANCVSAGEWSISQTKLDPEKLHCERIAIEKLWDNPKPYVGKRICVFGFLGRMVPYGEDSADLFSTEQEADIRQSEHYITISVPLTPKVQEGLAAYSGRRIVVSGIFGFDSRCWPKKGESEAQFRCFPARPMKLLKPVASLAAPE